MGVALFFTCAMGRLGGKLEEILGTMCRDNVKSWKLRSDGTYQKLAAKDGESVRSQQRFMEIARERAREAESIFGFAPNEKIGFWLNVDDGSIYGDPDNYDIGPDGAGGIDFTLSRTIPPGMYSFVFQGTTSGHQAIVYFKVLKP